jgi:Thioredoxin-like
MQDKNVLVYVHAAYCIPCRALEKFVLPVPAVKDSLQKFVFVSKYGRLLDGWEESYGHAQLDNFSRDIYKTCQDSSVCKKLAHFIGRSLASSKDTDEFTYLRYAVLLRKGGEDDVAQAAYERALAISPDDEKRSWVQEEWNQFAIANAR